MNELLSLSPIDGRYLAKTKELADSFSEYALIKNRVYVEIKWLLYLIDKKIIDEKISKEEQDSMRRDNWVDGTFYATTDDTFQKLYEEADTDVTTNNGVITW